MSETEKNSLLPEGYLTHFDLVTDSPVRCWQDGIAIGNGELGALAYTAEGFYPEWLVNLNSLWDERIDEPSAPPAMENIRKVAQGELDFDEEMRKFKRPGKGRVPTPAYGVQLRLEPGIPPQYAPGFRIGYRLSLADAVLNTHLDKHFSHMRVKSFISAARNVLAVRVSNVSLIAAFSSKVRLFRTPAPEYPQCETGVRENVFFLRQSLPTMTFTAAVKIVPVPRPDKGEYREYFEKITHPSHLAWGEQTDSKAITPQADTANVWADVCGDFDIFLVLQKNGDADSAVAAVEDAAAAGWETLYEEHRAEWAGFWSRNAVDLGDDGLTQLWYLSNYHLRLGSGADPAWGLCGPWFGNGPGVEQALPWHGFFTNNYNAQTMPLALENINHGELAVPLYQMLRRQLPQAKINAELYECPGAYYPMSSGPDGKDASPEFLRYCQVAGPYWCTLLHRHWKYSGDTNFLRNTAWDIIRETARFFAAYLCRDGEEYHLKYSQNPELQYLNHSDPIDTLAFLKETLKAACEISEVLGENPAERESWKHILRHYPAYPVSKYGFSPLQGLPDNHVNHLRTLAAVFPIGELDPEFPSGQIEDARKELDNPVWDFFMKSYACPSGSQQGWTGKTYHSALPACRFGLAEKAWQFLGDLIGGTLKPNGLFSHNIAILADSVASESNVANIPETTIYHNCGPEPMFLAEVASGHCWEECTEDLECKEKMLPVLEGPAVFLLLVSEMLLQSHNNLIRLFPAWPESRNARFCGLAAEGGMLVAAEILDGSVAGVRITAARSGDFALLNPWLEREIYRDGKKIPGSRHVCFTLQAGETTVFTPTAASWQWNLPINAEPAKAHILDFGWGRKSFLGKPAPAEYLTALTAFLEK